MQAQKQNMCIYSPFLFLHVISAREYRKDHILVPAIFFSHLFFLHCRYGEGNQACDLYLLVNLLVPWSEVTAKEDMLY